MRDNDLSRKIALILVASLTVMSSATIAASLPRMADVFRDTPDAEFLTKLVLTTPNLMIVVFGPIAGAIIDRFGRVRFLYANLVLYGFAGASGYVLDDLYHILVSRALLGIAMAGTMTTVNTLAGDYWTGEHRARYAGIQSAAMSLGGVVFIGAGGLLADLEWRLPFLVYLAAWPILIPAVKYLDEPERHAHARGEGAVRESLPVGTLAAVCALAFAAMVMFYMLPTQLPFLVRDIGIGSSALAALAIVVASVTLALGSLVFPAVKRHAGFVTVYVSSMLLVACGYALTALFSSYAVVLVGAAIAGFGVGLLFPNATLWVLMLSPARLRGRLTGMLSASVNLGQFSSPVLVQPAVVAVGLAGAFGVFAGIAGFVALALLLAGRRLEKTPAPGAQA